MKYGYYLAESDLLCGDIEFAKQAKDIYLSYGLNCKHAYRYDGVSIYLNGDITIKRIVLRDFFSEKFRALCYDLPSE
jgi:hypothetical protein